MSETAAQVLIDAAELDALRTATAEQQEIAAFNFQIVQSVVGYMIENGIPPAEDVANDANGVAMSIISVIEKLKKREPIRLSTEDYQEMHTLGASVYESKVPPDYRYSALALRAATDAAIKFKETKQYGAA